MSQDICCICLDSPTKLNPMYLLGCGCKVAWFHRECEYSWVKSVENTCFNCPTCRREVPIKTIYSFSYYAGPEQRALWYVGAAIAGEALVTCIIWKGHILPFQSASILLIPFVIPSIKPLEFYMSHVKLKYIFQALLSLIFIEIGTSMVDILIFYGYWYTFVLHLFTYVSFIKDKHMVIRDTCLPFAISREIVHVAISTETVSLPLKGDKT